MLNGIDTLKRGTARPRACAVLAWLSTLDPTSRQQAEDVLADKDIQHRVAHRFFVANGAPIVSEQSVSRHRRGLCCKGVVA